jgi:formylglycine-generating enzyme required for sulfatase activity
MFKILSHSGLGRALASAALLAVGLTGATMPAQAEVLDARMTPSSTPAPVISVDPATLPDFALFRECEECPQMVALPAGSFNMGSPSGETDRESREGPQRTVRIDYQFAVGRYEVTWAEYAACVTAGACPALTDDGRGKGSRPVTNVSWEDAKKYASWLSGKTGQTYRLLSEAEWEYAARSGSQARWSFGEDESRLGSFGWYWSNTNGVTQPVGGKGANAFGLHDMHGNVWEWVEDCYEAGYSAQPSDGSAFTNSSCSSRVVRGGSVITEHYYLRSAYRDHNAPGFQYYSQGFRLARALP